MIKAFTPKSINSIMDKSLIAPEESRRHFENHYNSLLKTKQGLSYICMKYPNLSITSAINEFLAEAWIIENSNLT